MDIKEVPVILDADKLNVGKTVKFLKTHDEGTDQGIEKKYQKGKNKRQDEKIGRCFLGIKPPAFHVVFHPASL
jgi:hypothetical protein